MARVTVVNDNEDFLELVRDILEDDRYETTTIDGDKPDALDRVKASRPDVLIIDLRMGDNELHGWDIAQQVRTEPALEWLPVLLCSADIVAVRRLEAELSTTKAVEVLLKPFRIDELIGAVDRLLAGTVAG